MDRTSEPAQRKVVQRQVAPAIVPSRPSLQRAGRRVLQRRGEPIPGGAVPIPDVGNSVDGSIVVSKLTEFGNSCWSGFGGFQGTPVERQIINAFETANLQPRSIAINWTDERGLNKVWTGSVNIRMENKHPVGASGAGTTTGGGGGTGTSGTSTSSASTTTGGGSGEVSEKDKAKAGVSGSGSQTNTQGEAQGASGASTTGASSADTLQRYQCTIVADIFLRADADLSGSDYINPVKWGMYLNEAVEGPTTRSGSVACGTWTFQVSAGFAPPAAAPAP